MIRKQKEAIANANDALKNWLGYYSKIIENIEQRNRRNRSLKIVETQ